MAANVNDIFRVTAKMSYSAGEVQNVFHWKLTSATTSDNDDLYDAICAKVDDAFDYLDTYLTNGLSFDTIDVFNLTQDEPLGNEAWPTLTAGGETTEQAYANQVAALVLFDTQTARSQGRKFIGGLSEGIIEGGGVLSSAFQTALASFAAELLTPITTGGGSLYAGNWNETLVRFAVWYAATVIQRAATQRRRRYGVGS